MKNEWLNLPNILLRARVNLRFWVPMQEIIILTGFLNTVPARQMSKYCLYFRKWIEKQMALTLRNLCLWRNILYAFDKWSSQTATTAFTIFAFSEKKYIVISSKTPQFNHHFPAIIAFTSSSKIIIASTSIPISLPANSYIEKNFATEKGFGNPSSFALKLIFSREAFLCVHVHDSTDVNFFVGQARREWATLSIFLVHLICFLPLLLANIELSSKLGLRMPLFLVKKK